MLDLVLVAIVAVAEIIVAHLEVQGILKITQLSEQAVRY
jgi:hypothetical protein